MADLKSYFSADLGTTVLNERIAEFLRKQTTSFWLQRALTAALERDILKAARDAEVLSIILKNRHDAYVSEIIGSRLR